VTPRHWLLVGRNDFLHRLRARPWADNGDGDVLSWDPPRQLDQSLCQLKDAHRLAHVEREHSPTDGQRSCLENELDSFLHAHEVERVMLGSITVTDPPMAI
jgi:hypothetical protein